MSLVPRFTLCLPLVTCVGDGSGAGRFRSLRTLVMTLIGCDGMLR